MTCRKRKGKLVVFLGIVCVVMLFMNYITENNLVTIHEHSKDFPLQPVAHTKHFSELITGTQESDAKDDMERPLYHNENIFERPLSNVNDTLKRSLSYTKPRLERPLSYVYTTHTKNGNDNVKSLQGTTRFLSDYKSDSSMGSFYVNIFTTTLYELLSLHKYDCVVLNCFHRPSPICVYNGSDDKYVSAQVRYSECWEYDLVFSFIRAVKTIENVVVLDLGCNIGVVTITAASHGLRVVGVDPVSKNLQLLSKSLRLGGIEENVTLVLNAVSNKRGTARLREEDGNIGGTSIDMSKNKKEPHDDQEHVQDDVNNSEDMLNHIIEGVEDSVPDDNHERISNDFKESSRIDVSVNNQEHSDNDLDETPTVTVVTLDDLVDLFDNASQIVVKMDIEGSEFNALQGGEQFLTQLDVRFILLEWFQHRGKETGKGIIQLMTRFSFLPCSPFNLVVLELDNHRRWPDNVLWTKV